MKRAFPIQNVIVYSRETMYVIMLMHHCNVHTFWYIVYEQDC